jgi:citrate lyase subunit beta/citryl-CoA lyase
VRIWPLLESPGAVLAAGAIAAASPRVAYLGGGTSRGGDLAATVGYQWTAEGLETLHLRSHVLLAARAAGIRYPMTGVVTALDDQSAVTIFARQSRQLGYDGMLVIHPDHVAVANAVFGTTAEERAAAHRTLRAVEAAAAAGGDGATALDGHMVDLAMRDHARLVLARRSADD